jgi:hypothetical protein
LSENGGQSGNPRVHRDRRKIPWHTASECDSRIWNSESSGGDNSLISAGKIQVPKPLKSLDGPCASTRKNEDSSCRATAETGIPWSENDRRRAGLCGYRCWRKAKWSINGGSRSRTTTLRPKVIRNSGDTGANQAPCTPALRAVSGAAKHPAGA